MKLLKIERQYQTSLITYSHENRLFDQAPLPTAW